MGRLFNGTSDCVQIPLDLSRFSVISLSFWMWWDTNGFDNKFAMEHTALYSSNSGFVIAPNNAPTPGTWVFGFANSSASLWLDQLTTRPTAAKWNHFLLTMDRSVPVNTAFVNGQSAALTTTIHNAATYGLFTNSNLNLMCRNQASAFGAGRMSEVAVWGGVKFGLGEASLLSKVASPLQVRPDRLVLFPPIQGAAANRDPIYGRMGVPATNVPVVTGTTGVPHPYGYRVVPRPIRRVLA